MNAKQPSALAETLLRGVMTLVEPPQLHTRTSGRSGAQTFEVIAGPRRFILKLDADGRTEDRWRSTLAIQRAAAQRGVTPGVIAWDAPSRAVLSEQVPSVSLFGALFDPSSIDDVLGSVVDALASLHALDPALGAREASPLERCRSVLEQLPFVVPAFAERAWMDFMARGPTPSAEALCHLDLNPSNLVYDGRKIWLVDWDTADVGDRWVDLATIVNMLLLPPERVGWLLERYASAAGVGVPAADAFDAARRLVYVGYGCAFLGLVSEPPGVHNSGEVSLAACYRALQEGRLDMNTAAGRWQLARAYFAGYWELG